MRAAVEQQPRRLWCAALFAAAAIATKDQAYALFLLSLPMFLFLWLDDAGRARNARAVFVDSAAGRGRRRCSCCCWWTARSPIRADLSSASHFLAGPASGDYAAYPRGWDGCWLC